jgi:hypothetical protein
MALVRLLSSLLILAALAAQPVADRFTIERDAAAADVEAALRRRPSPEQRSILVDRRRDFTDARFVPMLKRLAGEGSGRDGPAGVATRLLNEVAPGTARRVLLDDLKRDRPRIPIEGARLLREQTLPSLERTFVRQLQRASDEDAFSAALDRIERYGTASIARDVRRAYDAHGNWRSCTTIVPALAYFFRVEPGVARDEFHDAWPNGTPDNPVCLAQTRGDGLFPSIAERRTSRALEDAAIAALDDPDAELAADATVMLADYGSPHAEPALWKALRARAASNADLESRLVGALANGVGWRLADSGFDRLAALCSSEECRRQVADQRPDNGSDLALRVYGPDPTTWQPSYIVGMTRVRTRAQLNAKLLQYPAGSAFAWNLSDPLFEAHSFWLPEEQQAEFMRVDRFLRAHGMSLKKVSEPRPSTPHPPTSIHVVQWQFVLSSESHL